MTVLRTAAALLACLVVGRAAVGMPVAVGFEPSLGQTGPNTTFIARGSRYTAFVRPTGVAMRTPEFAWSMNLIDADPHVEADPSGPLGSRVHYLRGPQERWRTDVPAYRRVEYHGIYPGIDVAYSLHDGRFQYRFVLKPGADPAQIRLRFDIGERLELDRNEELVLRAAQGEWRHTTVAVYQLHDEQRLRAAGHFIVQGPHEVAFAAERYDKSLTMAIEVCLTYSTYLGGTGQSTATSIAVDAAGNVYVTGYTESLDFPETAGTRLGQPGDVDAYVAKLDPAGKLVYLTYLGGSGDDRSFGIAVDVSGAAVIAGWTYSGDLPIVNGAQSKPGGGRDGFVAKLNATGNALVFSTYLGGSGSDSANSAAVDQQGNIYVAGETASSNFPVLNPFQRQLGGGEDAFIAKFSSMGVILYSTYLGGMADDRATAIAVDASGNTYVTGSTYSSNLPVTGALQASLAGGQDAFAAKIGSTGSALVYCTYLGGASGAPGAPETGSGIAVDSSGSAYIAGTTSSSNFPTSDPIQSSLSGSQDAFVLKLGPSGNTLVYSTYLGGSSIDLATAITIDGSGRAYVAGYTASTDFPIVNAIQTSEAGGYDAFIVRLNPSGTALEMSTTFGGSGSDSVYGIAVDAAGNIYVGGQTLSNNFPTINALQVSDPSPASSFVAGIPGPCLFTLDQSAYSIGTAGGILTAKLTATAGCAWFVTNNYPGTIAITSGASGAGNGTILLTIGPNHTANARGFDLPVGNTSIHINQPGALQLVPVAPCRVMDTRNAPGPLGGPYVGAGTTRAVPVASSACGIPASAAAYSLNITVVPRAGSLSYLSAWPTGQPQPLVSTLNAQDGSLLANAAIIPAGAGGAINVFATNDTELIVDINGYFVPPAAGTLQFYPLTPCRVLDTRNSSGTFGGPAIAGGASRSFPIPASGCGVPPTAAAYALNVTAVPHGQLGYLTTWPTGQSEPLVSTLNSLDGTVLANAAIVPAGTNGAVSFLASNTADIVADINGYFAAPGTGGLNFYTVTPCRIVDTRNPAGIFGGPILTGGTSRTFPLSEGACGLPANTEAYSLNTTVVPSGVLGYLTLWAAGGNQPAVSTLNAEKGQVVANAAIVPAGAGGAIDVFVTNSAHVIIDCNGYFGQ